MALLHLFLSSGSAHYLSCDKAKDANNPYGLLLLDEKKLKELNVNHILFSPEKKHIWPHPQCRVAGTHLCFQPLLVSCGLLSSSNNQTPWSLWCQAISIIKPVNFRLYEYMWMSIVIMQHLTPQQSWSSGESIPHCWQSPWQASLGHSSWKST